MNLRDRFLQVKTYEEFLENKKEYTTLDPRDLEVAKHYCKLVKEYHPGGAKDPSMLDPNTHYDYFIE